MTTHLFLTVWVVQSVISFLPILAEFGVYLNGQYKAVDRGDVLLAALLAVTPFALFCVVALRVMMGVQALKSSHSRAGGSTVRHDWR